MATLVVPGVRVEARFDILPPLPAAAGILGAVGIVDRPPADGGLVVVSKMSEVRELLGPGTQASMPEVFHALANGVSEVVISPVSGGKPAKVSLLNADSQPAVLLRARSNGTWGNLLRADVREIADAAGNVVRVSIRLLLLGRIVESFDDLQVAPSQPDDLFDVINLRSRYVVALDPGFSDAVPKKDTYAFDDLGTAIKVKEDVQVNPRDLFELLPAEGASPSGLSVKIDVSTAKKVTVQVFQAGLQEEFKNLSMDPDSNVFLPFVLLTQSRLVRVRQLSSLAADKRLPDGTLAPEEFKEGESPSVAAYGEAIDRLADDTRVDLVLASIEPTRTNNDVRQIHMALVAHAVAMADSGAPRIAFGSVTADEQTDPGKIRDHAAAVRNRRFALVSPAAAEGAVAGMIGRLNPRESPTFKPVPLFEIAPARYREGELNRLLGPTTNALVVQERAGRGIVVLRGLDTTGDQISVTRVADLCIRETKAIAENFIGTLNNEDARTALRQQLIGTFTRMEREGSLVPSTDGKDPAFLVDVYSTQLDFAQGIVRIDIAVRPVRAIDYIYATIRVKN
jgi:hypothetical protein